MGRAPLVDLKEICQLLNAQARRLAPELLPRGAWEGPYWVEAKRKNGGLGDSLKVDTRSGRWNWYSAGPPNDHGDMLDLYCLVHDVGKVDGIKWARAHLGLTGPISREQRATMTKAREIADRRRAEADKHEAEDLEKARAAAKGVWLGSQVGLLGTPAGRYLEARGIELERLVRLDWGLHCLRSTDRLWHPYAKAFFPALLALAIFPDGRTASLHRTYLVERDGRWDRLREDLDGHAGKLLYTKIHGGVIPLWRGSRIKDGTGEVLRGHSFSDDKAGPDLRLIEGLENGLTVVQLDPDRRLACTYSLSNVCQLKLPKQYKRLTWIRDNDAEGSQADQLLDRALDHLADLAEEDGLFMVRPPANVKDFNAGVMPANNETAPAPSDDRQTGRSP